MVKYKRALRTRIKEHQDTFKLPGGRHTAVNNHNQLLIETIVKF